MRGQKEYGKSLYFLLSFAVYLKIALKNKVYLKGKWASMVAQTVKNLPAMQETQVWSLDWEDPPEKGMGTHSRILFFFLIYLFFN